jgi:Mandelate racemase / muconate lactonizing enzyme, N-terminal domain
MIITGVEPIALRIPFKAGIKSDASAWGDSNLPVADSLLVKVTTDQGLVGWGEAFGFRAVASAKLAIEQLIAPLCIGQDAARIEPLMLEVQKKLHVFGRGGALAFAISAVDIALWDIAPTCRCAGCWEVAPQICPAMRAWSDFPTRRLSEPVCGRRLRQDSARLSCMRSSLRRSAPPAREPVLISS